MNIPSNLSPNSQREDVNNANPMLKYIRTAVAAMSLMALAGCKDGHASLRNTASAVCGGETYACGTNCCELLSEKCVGNSVSEMVCEPCQFGNTVCFDETIGKTICVDTDFDSKHCGGCKSSCTEGAVCSNTFCVVREKEMHGSL
jgi:hypothetical protein